ncbi:hypothetical protein VTG60DRAFT_2823 [Thermothelomyces hinnuleus]
MPTNETNTTADGLLEAILETLPSQFNPLLRLSILLYNKAVSHLGLDPTFILLEGNCNKHDAGEKWVDLKVAFGNATQEQARQIFLRMYA